MVKKILSFFSATLLVLLFSTTTQAQERDYFSDKLIIKYESEQKLQQIKSKQKVDPKTTVEQLLNQYGVRQNRPLLPERLRQTLRQKRLPSSDEILRIREISFVQKIDPVQLAAKISRLPGVAYAEPRYIRQMNDEPNDPKIQKFVYAHNFIDAWDLSQGSADVTIAIVDGGVGYTHSELDENLWVNQNEIRPSLFSQVDQNGDGRVISVEINQYLQDNGDDYNGDGTIDLEDALHDDSPFTDNIDNDDNNFTDDLFGWDFWATGQLASSITSDNNPFHDATDHGTHVAGIAAAETNNGEGIAGAAFNATYMPVKVGGTADAPNTIGFGFEGILYAAEQGADIINCSWGGSSPSEAEEDIINFVTEKMGALVIAAAGNDANRVDYPARYDKVLAVGSVETDQTKSSFSNFGYNLDVLATGYDILSTSFNNDLAPKAGTSMSAPVVSGLAALIKEIHPNWTAERIGMQIRASASDIDNVNRDSYQNRLGRGSIDAFEALNADLPGLKMVSFSFIDSNGDKLLLGESGFLNIILTNVGNTTSSLELQLESLGGEVELGNSSQQLGSIGTGDTVEVSFDLTIPTDFDLSEIPTFRLNFIDGDYDDFNVILYEDLFYDIVAGNNVKTSFGAEGTIGFSDPLNARAGVGFIPRTPDGSGGYNEGNNLLFEGGLIVEINGEIYDAVRSTPLGNLSRDFFPQKSFSVSPTDEGDGVIGNTQFVTIGDTVNPAIIDLQTYAFNDPGISNVVFVKYTIQNPSTYITMNDVYAGIFNDWDIGNNPGNNNASFSEADSILYLSDASASSQPVVAVAHLGPISGALAIDNTIQGRPDSVTFGLYDGFTDGEKSSALTSGIVRTDLQNTDVSAVTASGPYILNPGAKVDVGFVYAFGDDVDQLRSQITEARSREIFSVSPAGRAVSDEIPEETRLFQNFPNPFHEETQIHIDLQESMDVKLTIYDTVGRKVRVLADGELEAGSHFISFNPEGLSSGVYFAHLEIDGNTETIGMTFIKS